MKTEIKKSRNCSKKFVLHKLTIAKLNADDLEKVNGGGQGIGISEHTIRLGGCIN
ncbi:MAG: hypothetical protein GY940_44885 [bacterium]|nr:hypothetical protein [bacterium]